MRNIFFPLIIALLMMGSVSAAPQLPFIIYGSVDNNGAPLVGANVNVEHNGISYPFVTNSQGKYVIQLGTYADGETITVRVLDNCASGDICQKSVVIGTAGNTDLSVVDFAVTGDSTSGTCPTTTCAPCDCSSSSSSSGSCYIPTPTEEKCTELYPCSNKVLYVPTMEECKEVCPAEKVCEEPKVCEVCVEPEPCEEKDVSWLISTIAAIILVMGGGVKIYRNRAGGVTILHRHKGILGYHNPDTQHRNKAYRHAALTDDPKEFKEDVKQIENEGSL